MVDSSESDKQDQLDTEAIHSYDTIFCVSSSG